MSDAQPIPDGVTILGGGQVLVDTSIVSPNPPPAAPPPTAAEAAKQFLRENADAYFDPNHPDYRRVRQEVSARFDRAYAGRVESDGASSQNFYAEPQPAATPATPTPAAAPKAAPVDPLDTVPRTAAQYGVPVPADAPPDLTPAMWQTLLSDARAAGLTTRQAQSWASFADVKVLRRALEVGYDALPLEQLADAAAERLRLLGVPDDRARALLETGLRRLVDARPRPVVDVSALEAKQRELIEHPAYSDPFHAQHKRVRAEVSRLAAEIVRKRPVLLQG